MSCTILPGRLFFCCVHRVAASPGGPVISKLSWCTFYNCALRAHPPWGRAEALTHTLIVQSTRNAHKKRTVSRFVSCRISAGGGLVPARCVWVAPGGGADRPADGAAWSVAGRLVVAGFQVQRAPRAVRRWGAYGRVAHGRSVGHAPKIPICNKVPHISTTILYSVKYRTRHKFSLQKFYVHTVLQLQLYSVYRLSGTRALYN